MSGLFERSLWNDFGSEDLFGFLVGEFIAAGEPSLSEEFSLDVSLDDWVSHDVGEFFLNYRSLIIDIVVVHFVGIIIISNLFNRIN